MSRVRNFFIFSLKHKTIAVAKVVLPLLERTSFVPFISIADVYMPHSMVLLWGCEVFFVIIQMGL